jgi:hypothetical protein
MIVYQRRACTILHNVLRARRDPRPFLVPANVCPIVPVTFMEAGQPFELIDISEPWLEIDRSECLARVSADAKRYAGLLFVHPYGSERRPDEFFAALRAAQPDLLLIDDKCLCAPDCEGNTVSALADVTLFSTGHAKYADLNGGGFAHLADSIDYQSEVRPFLPQALDDVTARTKHCITARVPFGQPAPGWLDSREPQESWTEYSRQAQEGLAAADEQKKLLNDLYAHALPPEIQLPPELQRWRFSIRVSEPARLIEAAFGEGVFASRHYPPLDGVFGSGRFPVAARLYSQVCNLFNDRYFDRAKAKQMTDVVLRHLER